MSRSESLLRDSRRAIASAAPAVSLALRPQWYFPWRIAWSNMPCARGINPGFEVLVASTRMNSCIAIYMRQ